MASSIPMDHRKPGRLWPLDLLIAALAGLVLYLICTQLSVDDTRWQYNSVTYFVAIPVIALVADFLMRGLASKYAQKSFQIGFLFSVALHLLMLMLATGVIIFRQYFPENVVGVKPERSPVKRTVPEYLFKTTAEQETEPDWSKPADAETASPVVPVQERPLPPVEKSSPKLEVPSPKEPIREPDRQRLIRRETASESLPQPANSPSRLTRRESLDQSMAQQGTQPVAPKVSAAAEPLPPSIPNEVQRQVRSDRSDPAASLPLMNRQPDFSSPTPQQEQPLAGRKLSRRELPQVGEMGISRPQRSSSRQRRISPAGAAPAASAIAVARDLPTAERVFSQVDSEQAERGQARSSALETPDFASPVSEFTPDETAGTGGAEAIRMAAAVGLPDVSGGESPRKSGRSRRSNLGSGFEPAGSPEVDAVSAIAPNLSDFLAGDSPSQEVQDHIGNGAMSRQRTSNPSTPMTASDLGATGGGAPAFDVLAPDGPTGFAAEPNQRAGVVASDQEPSIAALDLTLGKRPRREVGGPVVPFGAEIASVESFNRRVMRTQGGQTPTPAGAVGPATEEAIERGLAYLASIQNEDGSWSLQGHGTDVLLRSDTAATGLCLLAFQGAGYTHKQHQFASTVRRGLEFLTVNQKTNGDLFRAENRLSNRNVAFYSHGIAALAMSEAYGMTQDQELKDAAQRALDFIAATQHRRRGGWRYTPQVSADTSVTGWMMMSLKSGQLSGLEVSEKTYAGINHWLSLAQSPTRRDRYRYDPFAPDTPAQRHGRLPTPTMTSVGMLMRMYAGWRRDTPEMQSAAEYLLKYPPQMGTAQSPQRDAYYWYYATQVMFHMGGDYWERWNHDLNPVLLKSQLTSGPYSGSWDPKSPVPDRWSVHAGRLYVTTMNLLNLEVYYRHLPIYEETAQ